LKKLFVVMIIVGLTFIFLGAKAYGSGNNDALLKRKIVSSWAEGERPYSIATFESDGNYHGKM
jgi:hypothetical protein